MEINATAPDGIANQQAMVDLSAGLYLSAGNTFGSSTFNIVNTGGSITYTHDGIHVPVVVSPSVYLIQAAGAPQCASRLHDNGEVSYSSLDLSELQSLKSSLISSLPALENAYNHLTDAGNTEALLLAINAMSPLSRQDTLLKIAPFVSEKMLRHIAENSLMTDGLLEEVLIANPDALRNKPFLDFLEDETGLDRDVLEAAARAITLRTLREATLAATRQELAYAYKLLLAGVKNDTVFSEADLIPELLDEQASMESAYELFGFYVHAGNIAAAATRYGSIAEQFGMDGEKADEYAAYGAVWQVIQAVKEQEQVSLNADQVSVLTGISENFKGNESVMRQRACWYPIMPYREGYASV